MSIEVDVGIESDVVDSVVGDDVGISVETVSAEQDRNANVVIRHVTGSR